MTPKEDTNLTWSKRKPALIISYVFAFLTLGMAGASFIYFHTHWIFPVCLLLLSLTLFYASYAYAGLEGAHSDLWPSTEISFDAPPQEQKNTQQASTPPALATGIKNAKYTLICFWIFAFLLVIITGVSYLDWQAHWMIPLCFLLLCLTLIFSFKYFSGLEQGYKALQASHKELAKRTAQDEILLKEIHHRVKNNLQTVSSLLSLQARNVDDQNTRELFKNSQHRVISMALIHEMLYAYDDISRIQYQEYVEQLSTHLIRSIKGSENNIKLHVSMPDIKLGMETAVPLGLLINEFITNTLKHGIPEDTPGQITITLHKDRENNYLLQLRDNGVGFPEHEAKKRPNSLGLRLINNLVRQLRGSISREPVVEGVHFKITFREPEPGRKRQPGSMDSQN